MDFEADFEDNGYGFQEEDIGPQDAADMFGHDGGSIMISQQPTLVNPNDLALENTTADALDVDFDLPPVQVVNLIASVHLKCDLDLRLITISTRNIEYNPRRANCAIVRLPNPRITATVFQSGRLNILGAKTREVAKRAAKIIAKVIKRAGHPDVKFSGFKVDTLVCVATCGFPVRLENLAKDHSPFCNYEPEIFCGVVYRYNPEQGKKASVLIFVSGKLIITGCKSTEQADEVFKNLYPLLYQYRA